MPATVVVDRFIPAAFEIDVSIKYVCLDISGLHVEAIDISQQQVEIMRIYQPELADQPYNQLPQLLPEVDLESRCILKACIPARAALACGWR